MIRLQPYDEFDSNIDKFLISKILPRTLRLNNLNFQISESSTIFKTLDIVLDDHPNIRKIKLFGDIAFVVPSIQFLKSKLLELNDELNSANEIKINNLKMTQEIILDYINQKKNIDDFVFQYNIDYVFI